MQYSENLHLNLPEDSDPLDVSKLSENFEALDEAVSEAGAIAAEKAFKVGDTLTTWRTDLGENWLLCNGEPFYSAQYPELAAVCPGVETMPELAKRSNSSFGHDVKRYSTDGIHQVLFMQTASYTYGLTVSTDNFATFTTIHATVGGLDAFYVNNKWIMLVGSGSSGNTTVTKFHVADKLDGPWTEYNFSTTPPIANPKHLEFFNGKYYLFGLDQSNKKPVVAMFSDFTFTDLYSFVPQMLSDTLKRTGWNFVRTDSEFVYISFVSSSTGTASIVYVHTQDPATWGQENTVVESSRGYESDYVHYCDGKIIFFIKGYSNGLGAGSYLEYTDNFNSNGHIIRISAKSSDSGSLAFLGGMRGGFYIGLGINLLTIPKPEIDNQAVELGAFSDFIGIADITAKGGSPYWIYGNYLSFSIGGGTASRAMYIPIYAVPSISPPQSYAYIKAKEGPANGNQ